MRELEENIQRLDDLLQKPAEPIFSEIRTLLISHPTLENVNALIFKLENSVMVGKTRFRELDRVYPVSDENNDLEKVDFGDANISALMSAHEYLKKLSSQLAAQRENSWSCVYPTTGEQDINEENAIVSDWIHKLRIPTKDRSAVSLEKCGAKVTPDQLTKLLASICIEDIRFQNEKISGIITSGPIRTKFQQTEEGDFIDCSLLVTGCVLSNNRHVTVDVLENSPLEMIPSKASPSVMRLDCKIGFRHTSSSKLISFLASPFNAEPYVASLSFQARTNCVTNIHLPLQQNLKQSYQTVDSKRGIVTESFQKWLMSIDKLKNEENLTSLRRGNNILINNVQLRKGEDLDLLAQNEKIKEHIQEFILGGKKRELTADENALMKFLLSSAACESIFSDYIHIWARECLTLQGKTVEFLIGDQHNFNFKNVGGRIYIQFSADINRLTTLPDRIGWEFDRKSGEPVEINPGLERGIIEDPLKFDCVIRLDVKDGVVTPVLIRQEIKFSEQIKGLKFTDDTIKEAYIPSTEQESRQNLTSSK